MALERSEEWWEWKSDAIRHFWHLLNDTASAAKNLTSAEAEIKRRADICAEQIKAIFDDKVLVATQDIYSEERWMNAIQTFIQDIPQDDVAKAFDVLEQSLLSTWLHSSRPAYDYFIEWSNRAWFKVSEKQIA